RDDRPPQVAGEGSLEEDVKESGTNGPPLGRGLDVLREGPNDASEMRPRHPTLSGRILALLAGVVILKVTASVVSNYRNSFPPNFTSDFLRGREGYFPGAYRWAFYTHIISGPVSLVLGLILIGERSRGRFPKWHRRLGRVQVACVLL